MADRIIMGVLAPALCGCLSILQGQPDELMGFPEGYFVLLYCMHEAGHAEDDLRHFHESSTDAIQRAGLGGGFNSDGRTDAGASSLQGVRCELLKGTGGGKGALAGGHGFLIGARGLTVQGLRVWHDLPPV
jgi:hypothetical protein